MRGRVPGSGPFGAFPEVSRNEVLVRIAARLTHYLSGSVSLSFRGLRGVAGVTESTTGTTTTIEHPRRNEERFAHTHTWKLYVD